MTTPSTSTEPTWKPLETAARRFHFDCGDFMFMITTTRKGDGNGVRGIPVHSYKHHETRRYLHLDDSGNAYAYTDTGAFAPVPLKDAVRRAYS